MILIIYLPGLTASVFSKVFRIIQTRMMVLAVIHGLRPNQKLKSILEGCTDLTHLWGSTLHAHNLFSRPFFPSQSVYIRFTHIVNMQPKFYRGSAMHHTLVGSTVVPESTFNSPMNDLYKLSSHCATGENTTTCTFGHLSPIYTERADYRSLEMAIIQE